MLHMVSLFVYQMIGKRMPKKLQGYGTNNITKIIIIAVAYTNLIVWKHYKNNTHSIIDIHNTLQANRSRQYYIPKLIAVCVLAPHPFMVQNSLLRFINSKIVFFQVQCRKNPNNHIITSLPFYRCEKRWLYVFFVVRFQILLWNLENK